MMNYAPFFLLQASGQVFNRSWIIALIILLIVAGSWFTWNRRKNQP